LTMMAFVAMGDNNDGECATTRTMTTTKTTMATGQRATKLTMMAKARQEMKSTTMANLQRATNLTMMASANNDNDNGATTATMMAKATARRAMTRMTMMTVRQDATTRTMSNDVNGRQT